MEVELFHGPTEPASRRGQIARAAPVAYMQAREAARRDLRNKLRLAYRVPYHEWQEALGAWDADAAVSKLLERYGAKHWPPSEPWITPPGQFANHPGVEPFGDAPRIETPVDASRG